MNEAGREHGTRPPHGSENPFARRALVVPLRGLAFLFRGAELDLSHVLVSLHETVAGRASLELPILERLVGSARRDHVLARLTPSEQEVLALVADGLRNREIARRIWKSEKAVEKLVSHVFVKLGLQQRSVPHLDRRVTAARIFLSTRSQERVVPIDRAA